MPIYAQTYPNGPNYPQICPNMSIFFKYAQVYPNIKKMPTIPNCGQLRPNIPKCSQIYRNMFKYLQIYRNMFKCVQICPNISKYANDSFSIRFDEGLGWASLFAFSFWGGRSSGEQKSLDFPIRDVDLSDAKGR